MVQSNKEAIKIVIVGDGTVGKTKMLYRYTKHQYTEDYQPTIFEAYSYEVEINKKQQKISLWDTAGQEDFKDLRTLAYRNADVFIITFAVDNPNSFENANKKWFPELRKNNSKAKIIYAGNKIDLREGSDIQKEKFIQTKIATKLCEEKEVPYLECSAKSGQGVKTVFDTAIIEYLKSTKSNNQGSGGICNLI